MENYNQNLNRAPRLNRAARLSQNVLLAATACATIVIFPAPALAQAINEDDIIVTARKRQESLLNTPVIETAITATQLDRHQVLDLKDIAKLSPGLVVADAPLSVGAQLSVRGVGTSALDPGVDQSVSLNIDGLQLSQGLAFQAGTFDLAQAEVLKGPQALFYGKSSPGGVISLRTADPTDKFELIGRFGYEAEAREKRGELIISGPVSPTLKMRVAGFYSASDGYFKNYGIAEPGTGVKNSADSRVFKTKAYMVRGTALWNPSESFGARLKVNFTHDKTDHAGSPQLESCPEGRASVSGVPFIAPNEDCKVDRNVNVLDFDQKQLDPNNIVGIPNNGTPYNEKTQQFGTLEFNIHPARALTITSTSGYYHVHNFALLNTAVTSSAGPTLFTESDYHRRELTQELRVNSDYFGPFNFTAGGFYQDAKATNNITGLGNIIFLFPLLRNRGSNTLDIEAESLFGQGRYKPLDNVEIAAGARWTKETRSDFALNTLTGTPVVVPLAVPSIHSNNLSPELTLTYKPGDNVTIFGSLKRGYKSGSYTITTVATPGLKNSFGDERVDGGELGFKARSMDRQLSLNVASYYYEYKGLQVSTTEPPPPGNLTAPIIRVLNAGKARIYGVEADAIFRPHKIEGLTLQAAVNYNHARFVNLVGVPCYGGQTVAMGCNQIPNIVPTSPNFGRFTAQDLSGTPLIRSPDFSASFGIDYELPVWDGMKLVLSNSNQYSSKYQAALTLRKDTYQGAFIKTDLSIALKGKYDRWEIALIGKDLNDKITYGNCSVVNYANSVTGTISGPGQGSGQITGSTVGGPAGIDESACYADRGRQLWVRLTVRPFA